MVMNDVERATLSFEHALKMNPMSLTAMINLGLVLQDSSQYLQV